jgi:GT2 family glycosyltransferase
MSGRISAEFQDLIHALNRRYREQWDRAERLQAELDDIKGSRAFFVFRWLRNLRRLLFRCPRPGNANELRIEPLPNVSGSVFPPTGKVSILIPFKDHLELLRNCLHSLRRSTYRRLEILLLDNGSTEPDMARYLRRMRRRRGFRVVACPGPFNFAQICNQGACLARGRYLLFLNNDIEVQSPDWLEQMLQLADHPQVGVVGATLLYPDGTIQHAGIEPQRDGLWIHVYRGRRLEELGTDATQVRSVPAVTGACLMMRRDRFAEMGGFDERFPTTHNDVELCHRARQRGWLVAVTPHARLVHFESLSRGYSATDCADYAE